MLNLIKGQRFKIVDKDTGNKIHKVIFAGGWDPIGAKPRSQRKYIKRDSTTQLENDTIGGKIGNFINRATEKARETIQTINENIEEISRKASLAIAEDVDLDLNCVCFDEQKNILDVIYYGNRVNSNGSIRLNRDNRTGRNDNLTVGDDDERISVNLDEIPDDVKTILFVITSYKGHTFDKLDFAFCHLLNQDNNEQKLAMFNLTHKGDNTAMIAASFYKKNGEWKMKAIGEPANANRIDYLFHCLGNYI